jgi:predicted metal-dependent hydrolase
VTHKSPKIAVLIADCAGHPQFDAHYLGYFKCFNAQAYYEAHDVLEELWLADKHGPNGSFYKGLIQCAGGFVHLKLNHEFPTHRIHGARLNPAARLFQLAVNNWAHYPDSHEGLDLNLWRKLALGQIQQLESQAFQVNPWNPEIAPKVLPPVI